MPSSGRGVDTGTATNGVEVIESRFQSTVQDLGRFGLAAIGVGRSGAADLVSLRLANRLVANEECAAGVEVTAGGLALRAVGDLTVAVTGASCPLWVDGREEPVNSVIRVRSGAVLQLGMARRGLRSYVAVRGGIVVEPVLGSRSTDLLAGLGPEVLAAGMFLPVGPPPSDLPIVDMAPVAEVTDEGVVLRIMLGPRDDWFEPNVGSTLSTATYVVTSESNRIGMRLDGPQLPRSNNSELQTEGTVIGSLQVPPSGCPTLFLADHPVTGGYPVVAVVVAADIHKAAQLRPGSTLRFQIV